MARFAPRRVERLERHGFAARRADLEQGRGRCPGREHDGAVLVPGSPVHSLPGQRAHSLHRAARQGHLPDLRPGHEGHGRAVGRPQGRARALGARERPEPWRVEGPQPKLCAAVGGDPREGELPAVGGQRRSAEVREPETRRQVEHEVRGWPRVAGRSEALPEEQPGDSGHRHGGRGPGELAGSAPAALCAQRSRAYRPEHRLRSRRRRARPGARGAPRRCPAAACAGPSEGSGRAAAARRAASLSAARRGRARASPRPRSRRSRCRRRRAGGRSASPRAARRRTTRRRACRPACRAPARATCRRPSRGSRRRSCRCGRAWGTATARTRPSSRRRRRRPRPSRARSRAPSPCRRA